VKICTADENHDHDKGCSVRDHAGRLVRVAEYKLPLATKAAHAAAAAAAAVVVVAMPMPACGNDGGTGRPKLADRKIRAREKNEALQPTNIEETTRMSKYSCIQGVKAEGRF